MRNAASGNLQPYTKDEESHDAVNNYFIMRTDIADEPVGIQIK